MQKETLTIAKLLINSTMKDKNKNRKVTWN